MADPGAGGALRRSPRGCGCHHGLHPGPAESHRRPKSHGSGVIFAGRARRVGVGVAVVKRLSELMEENVSAGADDREMARTAADAVVADWDGI